MDMSWQEPSYRMLGYPTLLLLNSVACEYLLLNIFIPLSTWMILSSNFWLWQELRKSLCLSVHPSMCMCVCLWYCWILYSIFIFIFINVRSSRHSLSAVSQLSLSSLLALFSAPSHHTVGTWNTLSCLVEFWRTYYSIHMMIFYLCQVCRMSKDCFTFFVLCQFLSNGMFCFVLQQVFIEC